MYSGAVVKVYADSQQNNKKLTILHFKMGDFAKFRHFLQKTICSPQGRFLVIRQFFVKNEILWSQLIVINSAAGS